VHVEVEDEGGVWIKPESDGRPHGLDIIALLVGAGNWGIEPTSDGPRVAWARLDLPLAIPSLRLPWAIVRPPETAPVDTHQPGLSHAWRRRRDLDFATDGNAHSRRLEARWRAHRT
jgi:hypothetical protein